MNIGEKKSKSFMKIFVNKFSKLLPVFLLVVLVFSISAYAWFNNSANNNGNTIKTGETLAKVELLKNDAEIYSADNLRELNKEVDINGSAGDEFVLKISNSSEISIRYTVSAVANNTEFVTMQDDGSGLKGNVLKTGESCEYKFTLTENSSHIILRLETSYSTISPDEFDTISEISNDEVNEIVSETAEPTETVENTTDFVPETTEALTNPVEEPTSEEITTVEETDVPETTESTEEARSEEETQPVTDPVETTEE